MSLVQFNKVPICLWQFYYSEVLRASIFVSPTAERAADVDANGPHVGLVRITDAVVEGDEDAEGGKQQTQDQQEHSQGMQDYIDTSY